MLPIGCGHRWIGGSNIFALSYGNVVPTGALVLLTSVLLMFPLAFMSLRKLEAVTGAATWPLTAATSVLLTAPLADTSPIRRPNRGRKKTAAVSHGVLHVR